MPIRDAWVLASMPDAPFEGYSVRRPALLAPDVDRVVALVAIFATMVLSGVVLGRPRS